MNPVRELLVFARLNWRIIALCLLVAIVVAAVMRSDRNRGRFVPTSNPEYLLDTRTGQYCDPGPPFGENDVPKCAALAKGWR